MHERIEFPLAPRFTLALESVQVKPADVETLETSATVPAKPSIPVTVIVELPGAPAFTVTAPGLDEIPKSCTV